MTIHEIKDLQEKKHSELFNAVGLFFAFNNKQFEEGKTPLKEGDKYVSIGAGGYLPKSNVDAFIKGMDDIKKWYKAEVNASKQSRRALIVYELANHEAYYTGEIDDTMQALGSGFTKKEVWKVWHEENKKNQ